MSQIAYVYILQCQGNRYYNGYTTDPMNRWKMHQAHKVKFTTAFTPSKVLGLWKINSGKANAMKLEWYLKKKCTKIQKQAWIETECSFVQKVTGQFKFSIEKIDAQTMEN